MPKTVLTFDGERVLIDGKPTHPGSRCEGLLMNSRMVQALFDDENPETRPLWAYPDTGTWDPDRNTEEFCAALADYHAHGLDAVTVGLQGGGSRYSEPIYSTYLNTAFRPDGSLKSAYTARLRKVLEATDRLGMVCIVNFFYWRQERWENDEAVFRAVEEGFGAILNEGWKHVVIDLKNEQRPGPGLTSAGGMGRLLSRMREMRGPDGPPYIGTSLFPKEHDTPGEWRELTEYWAPHGNDSNPDQLTAEIQSLRAFPEHRAQPRPIFVNEDSIFVENMEAAVAAGAGWGYYDQGFGSEGFHGRFDWRTQNRESRYEDLSGFQTVPVNWSINTEHKRRFFGRLKELTSVV